MNPTGMLAAAARSYMQNKPQDVPEGTSNTETSLQADLFKKPVKMSELRRDWNNYNDWLRNQQIEELDANGKAVIDPSTNKTKMKSVFADPRLDTDLGMKLFRKYQKENPETTLSEEYFPIIRTAALYDHDRDINDYKSGKLGWTQSDKDSYKKYNFDPQRHYYEAYINNEISDNPNYPGRYLTQYRFSNLVRENYKDNKYVNSDHWDENQYHPDFTIDDYNKAPDKKVFLNNVYANFKEPGGRSRGKIDPYFSNFKSMDELINEAKEKKLSEKNNKTLKQ